MIKKKQLTISYAAKIPYSMHGGFAYYILCETLFFIVFQMLSSKNSA